jgi:hypothetical protein
MGSLVSWHVYCAILFGTVLHFPVLKISRYFSGVHCGILFEQAMALSVYQIQLKKIRPQLFSGDDIARAGLPLITSGRCHRSTEIAAAFD